jgi:hypothetical protein
LVEVNITIFSDIKIQQRSELQPRVLPWDDNFSLRKWKYKTVGWYVFSDECGGFKKKFHVWLLQAKWNS